MLRLQISHSRKAAASDALRLAGCLGSACHPGVWHGGERGWDTAAKVPPGLFWGSMGRRGGPLTPQQVRLGVDKHMFGKKISDKNMSRGNLQVYLMFGMFGGYVPGNMASSLRSFKLINNWVQQAVSHIHRKRMPARLGVLGACLVSRVTDFQRCFGADSALLAGDQGEVTSH